MLVYILEFMDYDDFQIVGVFTSMDKAVAEKKTYLSEKPKYGEENFEITEHEVK